METGLAAKFWPLLAEKLRALLILAELVCLYPGENRVITY
jgi:hypothetical protein